MSISSMPSEGPKAPLRQKPKKGVEISDSMELARAIVACATPPKSSQEFHDRFGMPPAVIDSAKSYFSELRDREAFDEVELELPHLRNAIDDYITRIIHYLDNSKRPIDKLRLTCRRILNLGSGGAVTPSVIQRILSDHPDVHFDFLDIDPEALESLKKKIVADTVLKKHISQFRFICGNFIALLETNEFEGVYDAVTSELWHHHVFYRNGSKIGKVYEKVLLPGGAAFELDQFVNDFQCEEERIMNTFAAHQAILHQVLMNENLSEETKKALVEDELRALHDAMQSRIRGKRLEEFLNDPYRADRLYKFIMKLKPVFREEFSLTDNPDNLKELRGTWFYVPEFTLFEQKVIFEGTKPRFIKGLLVKLDPYTDQIFIREPSSSYKLKKHYDSPNMSRSDVIYYVCRPSAKTQPWKYELLIKDGKVCYLLWGNGGRIEQKRGPKKITSDINSGHMMVGNYRQFSFQAAPMSDNPGPQGGIYVQEATKPPDLHLDFKKRFNVLLTSLQVILRVCL